MLVVRVVFIRPAFLLHTLSFKIVCVWWWRRSYSFMILNNFCCSTNFKFHGNEWKIIPSRVGNVILKSDIHANSNKFFNFFIIHEMKYFIYYIKAVIMKLNYSHLTIYRPSFYITILRLFEKNWFLKMSN